MVLTDYPSLASDTWEAITLKGLVGCGDLGCVTVQVESGAEKKPSTTGYIQVTAKRSTEKAYAHRLAWGAKYGFEKLPKQGEQLDISHICHNKRCCNIDHLFCETSHINQSRNHCWAQPGLCFHFARCLCQSLVFQEMFANSNLAERK